MDCARFYVKEIYTLYEVLQALSIAFSRSTLIARTYNRARVAALHRLLRALIELQMRKGFRLSLRWKPPEANSEAAGITPHG